MKYYIIAGEASGDLHGSNLMKALAREDVEANFRVWGGDLMKVAGGEVAKHYRDLAFMGFLEVVKNLRTILGNFKFCKKDILEFSPDVLILIDYPGFNLRMAKWAKKQGIKVFYYISPQIWAWHSSRVQGIKKSVDRMFVILPFEKDFYKKYDFEVDFVGHPLLDVVNQLPPKNLHEDSPPFRGGVISSNSDAQNWHEASSPFRGLGGEKLSKPITTLPPSPLKGEQSQDFKTQKLEPINPASKGNGPKTSISEKEENNLEMLPIIAILPGSRKQEIKKMLGKMLQIIPHFPDYQFIISGAPSQEKHFYENILADLNLMNHSQISFVENQTYQLLKKAKAALVTSGTATLETALFEVPQVVCYQGNQLSYLLARQLVNVEYISLVNLIMEKPLVKELIQNDFSVENLKLELSEILNKKNAAEMKKGYQELKEKLGNTGASERTAKLMIQYLAK